MLSANIFASLYYIPIGILSVLIGALSVLFIRTSKNFQAVLLFLCGALLAFLGTYADDNEYLLYKIGLNASFIAFLKMMFAMIISLLWLNASSVLNNQAMANKVSLTFYISICMSICIYYSFFAYNREMALMFAMLILTIGLLAFVISLIIDCRRDFKLWTFLLLITCLMLGAKLLIGAYFSRYNWLNLNLFSWSWIYVFTASMVFAKIDLLDSELEQSWKQIDKLNIQQTNMINSSPFPIMLAKINGSRILMLNKKAELMFGITTKELAYYKLTDFFVDENNRDQFFKLMEKNHEVENYDLLVNNALGNTPFWLSVCAKPISYNNEVVLYMAFQNITTRKERETNLQNQADHDALTMAWNRRYFEKQIPLKIQDVIKKSQYFSLLMIDADKFKNINDTYGHKTGDKVLMELAYLCKTSLRADDVVCRFGGEEFVIYLNNTNSQAALSVAERLRLTIEKDKVIDDLGNEIRFTVSIGVVSSEKTDSLPVLLKQVDDAMYLAKHNGRNRVELYNEQEVSKIMKKRGKSASKIHPVFKDSEHEEISLLDTYENHILDEEN